MRNGDSIGLWTDTRAFWITWGACTVAAVAPIWAFRFLPMQDYPQHLFYSFVLATWSSPEFDWATHFNASLSPGPYTIFYLLTSSLVKWIGAESAGSAVVTAYVLGLSAYVAVEAWDRQEKPWPLLIVLPLAFTQPYYMGFTNYFLAIPTLLFALRSHSQLLESGGRRAGPWIWQVACGLLLFFSHLSMIFVYVGLAALRVGRRLPRERPWAAALAPAAVGMLLAMWLWLAPHTQELKQAGDWEVHWWPFKLTLAYLALPFTGMRIAGGVRAGCLLAWLLITVAIGASLWRKGLGSKPESTAPEVSPSESSSIASDDARGPNHAGRILDQRIDLTASILAFLALPFWLAHYSYVNLRLASVVYLLAAIVLAQVSIRPFWRPVLVAGVLGLCITTWTIHREADAETAQLVPLLAAMEPNRAVITFYPDAVTRALDHQFFYQHHSHVHTYYHVLRGGGVSPTLFPTTLIPIQYRDPAQIPYSVHVERFSAAKAARFYTYLLIRGGEKGPANTTFLKSYQPIGVSGRWKLYQRVLPEVER
jgi:hypothetical protein